MDFCKRSLLVSTGEARLGDEDARSELTFDPLDTETGGLRGGQQRSGQLSDVYDEMFPRSEEYFDTLAATEPPGGFNSRKDDVENTPLAETNQTPRSLSDEFRKYHETRPYTPQKTAAAVSDVTDVRRVVPPASSIGIGVFLMIYKLIILPFHQVFFMVQWICKPPDDAKSMSISQRLEIARNKALDQFLFFFFKWEKPEPPVVGKQRQDMRLAELRNGKGLSLSTADVTSSAITELVNAAVRAQRVSSHTPSSNDQSFNKSMKDMLGKRQNMADYLAAALHLADMALAESLTIVAHSDRALSFSTSGFAILDELPKENTMFIFSDLELYNVALARAGISIMSASTVAVVVSKWNPFYQPHDSCLSTSGGVTGTAASFSFRETCIALGMSTGLIISSVASLIHGADDTPQWYATSSLALTLSVLVPTAFYEETYLICLALSSVYASAGLDNDWAALNVAPHFIKGAVTLTTTFLAMGSAQIDYLSPIFSLTAALFTTVLLISSYGVTLSLGTFRTDKGSYMGVVAAGATMFARGLTSYTEYILEFLRGGFLNAPTPITWMLETITRLLAVIVIAPQLIVAAFIESQAAQCARSSASLPLLSKETPLIRGDQDLGQEYVQSQIQLDKNAWSHWGRGIKVRARYAVVVDFLRSPGDGSLLWKNVSSRAESSLEEQELEVLAEINVKDSGGTSTRLYLASKVSDYDDWTMLGTHSRLGCTAPSGRSYGRSSLPYEATLRLVGDPRPSKGQH